MAAGGFGRPTTVKDWKSETESTIDKHFDNTSNAFTKILAMPQSNQDEIQRKINRLVGLNNAVMQGVGLISNNIKWAEDNSFGQDTWITYGTARLDKEGSEISNSIKMKQKEIQDAINAEQDKLKQISPSKPVGNKVDNQYEGKGKSWFMRQFDSMSKRKDLRDQLFNNLKSKNINDTVGFDSGTDVFSPTTMLYAEARKTFPQVFGSYQEEELANNKLVYDFLATKGNLDDLLQNKNRYAEFNEDPVGYVKTKMNMGN